MAMVNDDHPTELIAALCENVEVNRLENFGWMFEDEARDALTAVPDGWAKWNGQWVQVRAATAEPVALCTHRCLKPENHDGLHFHGYELPSEADRIKRLRDALLTAVALAGKHSDLWTAEDYERYRQLGSEMQED
jgi:hypothetical protein